MKTQKKIVPRKKTAPARARKTKKRAIAVQKKESVAVEKYIDEYDIDDPRQALFLRLYYDHESPSWGNARRSAIGAGYDDNYANQITYRKPAWWVDFVRKQNLAELIEDHFTEVMALPTVGQAMGAFGPIFQTQVVKVQKKYKNGKVRMVNQKIKVPVMVPNISVIKEKTAVSKIAAPAHDPERYGRNNGPKFTFKFNLHEAKEKYAV